MKKRYAHDHFCVGYYQFAPRFGDVTGNLNRIVKKLDGAKVDLLILPELALTGYYFKNRREAWSLAEDPARSSSVKALTALCKKNRFHIITGFAERRRKKVFNSALLIGPGGVRAVYRKLHLFFEEKDWFDPGDSKPRVWKIGPARVGTMICFDWIFPETARTLALQKADVIAHPSNLVMNYCQSAMITRSIENLVYIVTANRFGSDRRPQGTLQFTGQSQIVAPKGKLLHRSTRKGDELFIAELDLGLARDKRITRRNDLLRDRRPGLY